MQGVPGSPNPLDFVTEHRTTRVVFGAGSFGRAEQEVDRLGLSRVLVVVTPGRKADGEALAGRLGARAAGVLATAREHVPSDVAAEGTREAVRVSADGIFALGGGSAIGLAKAIALALEGKIKVIAAPTTYSGSEMTSMWGLTEGTAKRTGKDERVRAALVIYDPTLTLGLPRAVTVASAWNAIAHAVEALWAPGVEPATVAAAEKSIALFARALPRLASSTGDPGARAEALLGAHLAGVAIAEATMGLHHKICHVLGGRGLPHAETHAALLPHVVRFNRDVAPEAMARIARALDAPDAIAGVFALAAATGAPSGLARLGLARESIDDVVRAVLVAAPPNPRPLDERSLRNLLLEALENEPMQSHDATRPAGGFGGAMESEALAGALPRTQNAPRKCPYGLYPELVSGVPFTMRRAENTRLWLYKIRPSTLHGELARLPEGRFTGTFGALDPNRIRWKPLPIPQAKIDFLDGMHTLGGLGDPASGPGYAVHLYAASADMGDRCFTNADGDMLIVPQEGTLVARTECGVLRVAPGEVLLVPRGLKLTIDLPDGRARGYVGEVFGVRFRLPERGPIGSNGLADARHFVAPAAAYEDRAVKGYRIVTKIGGALWGATQHFSPYDVVAWHGNHVPYKYDLMLFNAMGSTTFDHPDPSIHTVLTAPLDDHGRAVCDFVCFRGRWDVIEHSLRPPFFHRNAATEVNGIVRASSVESGYEPGGCFVTPLLTGHGVTTRAYEAALALTDEVADAPRRLPDASLWIMFESALPFRLTRWAEETDQRDRDFAKLFEGAKSYFDPGRR